MNHPLINKKEMKKMKQKIAKPVIFGEVLFDCLPDGVDVLGGAPFNVAWNLKALGLEPIFVTRIGDDERGQKILDAMNAHNMDLQGLQVDFIRETGHVDVTLNKGEPTYDIVSNVAYDYIEPNEIPNFRDAGLLYHGSLSMRCMHSRNAFQHLAKRLNVPIFLDVNLRAPWYGESDVRSMMKMAKWCKVNQSELSILRNDENEDIFNPKNRSFFCPNYYSFFSRKLQTIYLTKGAEGASAITKHGEQAHFVPKKNIKVVDLIGAGDAFSSVLILGIMKGWDTALTMERAQEFAGAVVGIQGAVSTDPEFYASFKDAWQD